MSDIFQWLLATISTVATVMTGRHCEVWCFLPVVLAVRGQHSAHISFHELRYTLATFSRTSPWAKTQIIRYRYHLGGQNLVMFFMYTYAQRIIQAMIDLWTRQLPCGYHQFWLFYFSKNSILLFFSDFQCISKIKPSSIIVLIKCSCSNTRGYPLSISIISWKTSSNCDKFR